MQRNARSTAPDRCYVIGHLCAHVQLWPTSLTSSACVPSICRLQLALVGVSLALRAGFVALTGKVSLLRASILVSSVKPRPSAEPSVKLQAWGERLR